MANISRELETHLPEGLLKLLQELGERARGRMEKAFLVGGVVRDALLRRPNFDLDIVVEGQAIPLARQMAKAKGWAIRTHPRFGTAKLSWQDFSLDIVTARSETYAQPGALPTVKTGTIHDDLARRDFTINAMAVRLDAVSFGQILDPHGGRNDLDQKLIRVLHRGSFVDDPTRMLRAIRYEQRLDFRLHSDTEDLLRQNMDGVNTVTGERLWHEMELTLAEPRPEKALQRAQELGILQRLYPAFACDEWVTNKFAQARELKEVTLSLSAVYLALLVYRFDEARIEDCINRFRMPGWAARTMRDLARIKEILPSMQMAEFRRSELFGDLEGCNPEAIAATAVASDSPVIRNRLWLYLADLRFISPLLNGDDLHRLGVKPGREVGRVLRTLLEARLDQKVATREEEETMVRESLCLPPRS